MRLLTFTELVTIVWPGVDIAEEFGEGLVKFFHFPTRHPSPRFNVLQIITPSTASALQAERKNNVPEWGKDPQAIRFFVTPARSLTRSMLYEVIASARPFQVLIDADVLAPDLKADVASHTTQMVWVDEGEPPADWAAQILSELERGA